MFVMRGYSISTFGIRALGPSGILADFWGKLAHDSGGWR